MTIRYSMWFLGLALSTPAPLLADEPFVQCGGLPPLAGELDAADRAGEQAFCGIDFPGPSTAICPKTWSTSPAAVIYELKGTPWEGRGDEFEERHCAPGGKARDEASRELAFFKNSLNGQKTSGTFAPSSLLYYHLSRLLQTRVHVPVAVQASFATRAYAQRVVQPGVRYSSQGSRGMLHEGWLEMDAALSAPAQYSHQRELFIDDGARLWGVLLMPQGSRYGPEINGTRESGWGEGQNRDFQRTAPFIALRTDAPLLQAVQAGVREARRDPAMAKALPGEVSPVQVAWWMNEISEIVLLDYILGQQDRVGNIDYLKRWVWLQDGELRSEAARPESAATLLYHSVLNDNDAGVRSGYANYARSTDMLADWRHMDPGLYRRLQSLARDFRAGGEISQAIRQRYRLSHHEADRVIQHGIEAADYLAQRCEAGELRFDLGIANVLDPAAAAESPPPCDAPAAS